MWLLPSHVCSLVQIGFTRGKKCHSEHHSLCLNHGPMLCDLVNNIVLCCCLYLQVLVEVRNYQPSIIIYCVGRWGSREFHMGSKFQSHALRMRWTCWFFYEPTNLANHNRTTYFYVIRTSSQENQVLGTQRLILRVLIWIQFNTSL